MKKSVCLLLLIGSTVSGMWRSRQLMKPVRNVPRVVLPVRSVTSLVPHTLQTFQHWMAQQNPKTQQLINKYQVVRRYDHLLAEQASGNSQVNSQIQMFNTIMQSIMNDPEQAEEILQFYNQLNQANAQVHKALDKMPAEFQQLLDKRVQEYALHVEQAVQAEAKVLTPMQRIKMFMIRTYPYLVSSILLSMQILTLASAFFVQYYVEDTRDILENTKSLEELGRWSKELINLQEAYDVILNALSKSYVPIYVSLEDREAHLSTKEKPIPRVARAQPFVFSSESVIVLYPIFFEQPLEFQLFTLLHEIRHTMQYSQVQIPQDVLELASNLGVQKYALDRFVLQGLFYSRQMMEFDADTFAARSFKGSDVLVKNIGYRNDGGLEFNPSHGYLSGDVIEKVTGSAQGKTSLGKMSQNFADFVGKLKGENAYVRLLPDHIKQQAKQNRAKKLELQRFPKRPTENLFDHEW